jgi:transposase
VIRVDRSQSLLRPVIVERLIEEDHPARAVWELTGALNLAAFYEPIQAVAGVAGRNATDPRLLISLWLLAYSQGVGSAREVERRCAYHPAYQWLTGMQVINHHTLSDFRVRHSSALEDLFTQLLGVLGQAGLVTLERVMHDGTRVKACASGDTFRRESTLEVHLQAAREQVERLSQDTAGEDWSRRERAAQERAARERQQRLELAQAELQKVREGRSGKDREQARVSESDPESRVMKQGNGGYAPSYNVQISTDAKAGIVVGVGVSQSASDAGELLPALDQIQDNTGQMPEQVVVDAGFTSADNVVEVTRRQVELIGSEAPAQHQGERLYAKRGVSDGFRAEGFEYQQETDTYRCPAGKVLGPIRPRRTVSKTTIEYRARAQDCRGCPFRSECCPKSRRGRTVIRTELAPELIEFRQRMQTERAQQIYRQRGAIAEFPNAWIKDKLGLRQFHLRGLIKAKLEALWACLTYNVQQWIRCCWRVAVTA